MKIAMFLFSLAAIISTVSAQEVVNAEQRFSISIQSEKANTWQLMRSRLEGEETVVKVGDEEFINPTYSFNGSLNPIFTVFGAGEADDFVLLVEANGCFKIEHIQLENSSHDICDLEINIKVAQ